MSPADLPAIERIAALVHPAYPEDIAILAERQSLSPTTCFVLANGTPLGYAFAHPWCLFQPPKLDTKLRRLPPAPDTLYLHDIALLPAARGSRQGDAVVARLIGLAAAMGLPTMSLVAVGPSRPFWQRHGFVPVTTDALSTALASYDATACYMVRR